MSLKNDIIEAEFRTKGASVVQRDMSKISKEIAILTENNKDLKLAKAKLEAADKKYIAGTKKLTKEYQNVNEKMKKNNELLTIQKGKLQVQSSKLKLSEMSATQLKKKWRDLNKELDNPIMKVLPERQKRLNNELAEVERHMGKVTKGTAKTNSTLIDLKKIIPTLGITALTGILMKTTSDLFSLTKIMQGDAVRSSTVLGDSYGYVSNQADKMAAKMGLTNREFIANTAAAADLLVPLGFARDVSAEMATKLQGLVGPLDEWTGGQLGATEVSNILTKALLGENEQLKQLGIAIQMDSKEFTDLVKQYQARQGVTKAQAQAMAELELITRKSADAQTAYVGSGNKLLRMQKSISRRWKQLKEDIVNYLTVSDHNKLLKQVEVLQKQESQFASEQKTLTSLLGTYDSLKSKGQLTKDEQIQLNNAIKQIGQIVPSAITEFNKYGEAVGVNKDRIKEAREAQRLLNLEMKKDTIEDLTESIQDQFEILDIYIAKTAMASKKINSGVFTKSDVEGRSKFVASIKTTRKELAETTLKLKALGLSEEEISKKTGISIENLTNILSTYISTVKTSSGSQTPIRNLVKEQEDLLAAAKQMPQSTENEIVARNRKIQTIEEEIKRLKNLGLAQDNLDKFIVKSNEEQIKAVKEYFKTVGADAYEGFKKAYEDAVIQDPLNLKPITEEEEDEEIDPESDYAIQKYMQTLEFKQELLRIQRENDIIGEEEYQDRLDQINQEHQQKRYRVNMQYSYKARQMAQLGANFVNALMQMELEQAGDNEEKKKEIRKKYAVYQFMASASQIIVNTATAVMRALADLGPIAGPIAAGVIGATGAVQLGVTYAQMAKMRGMEEGGYTKVRRAQDNKEFRAKYQPNRRGFVDKPTILVGENDSEFVANDKAVKNPTIRPVLDVIDAAQRGGTIETLNLPAVMNSIKLEGKETGGYITQKSEFSEVSNEDFISEEKQFTSVLLDKLNALLNKPIRSFVVYSDIKEKEDEIKEIETEANL